MQGLSTLRMLRQLQDRTGRQMHELFDLVCGTSTGGILAAALAIRCVPLEECEEIYRSVTPGTGEQRGSRAAAALLLAQMCSYLTGCARARLEPTSSQCT